MFDDFNSWCTLDTNPLPAEELEKMVSPSMAAPSLACGLF